MKKRTAIILTYASLVMLTIATAAFGMEKPNLYNKFGRKSVVNLYIGNITNSTGADKVDIQDLKEKLQKALSDRKSINFKVVRDRDKADLTISCDVTKYYWSADDPIDMLLGTAVIAIDALTVENYAYLEATFTVTDAKKNKILWKRLLKIDLTKKEMSEKESLTLINEEAAAIFIRECFGKKKRGPNGL